MLLTAPSRRNVLDSISDGFFTLDHRWCFTYVNPAAVPMLRHYSPDLLGKVIWDVLPDIVGTELESHLRRAVRDSVPALFEMFYPPFDAWLAIRACPTLDDGGVAVYVQDVTDRKRADFDRRRLAAIVTSSQDAIVGVTLDGTITDWNSGAERLYGYSAREIVGRPLQLVFQANSHDPGSSIMDCIGRGEHIPRLETTAVRKNGGTVYVALSASPLRGESGQVIGGATIARDLTAQKAAQAQLRLLAAALEAAANAIVITDLNGHIDWVNPAFTRLTGYTLEEVRGENPRLLKSGKHDADFYRRLWRTILDGQVFRGEMINRRRDGSLYREHMTITPVRDGEGAITHFIAVKEAATEGIDELA
jgi:PAS domain S-box-containing protein